MITVNLTACLYPDSKASRQLDAWLAWARGQGGRLGIHWRGKSARGMAEAVVVKGVPNEQRRPDAD